MALVLEEGENRLPGLVGASVNTTTQQGPGAIGIGTSSSSALAAAERGTYAVVAVLCASLINLFPF